MIKIDALDDDYYFYDESSFSLIGRRSKKKYMLGDKINITVDSVIKDKGLINFGLYKGDQNGDKQQKSKA